MARKNKSSALWADNPAPADALVANPAAPSELARAKKVKFQKFAIYTLVTLGGLGVIMNISTLTSPQDEVVATTVDSIAVNSSLGKPPAQTTLATWLSADPSPLPGATIVSWDGFDFIEKGKKVGNEQAANAGEVHFFTLAAPGKEAPLYYTASVFVSVDDTLGAKVVGTPTIIPKAPSSSNGWSSTTWAGYTKAQVAEPVKEAVAAWADAFTDTPAALRLAVGDQDSEHAYIPLVGATVVETNITEAGYIKSDDTSKEPDVIIARVELKLTWPNSEDPSPSLVTYDLLIHDATTAAPTIVAWGGGGTGPTLKQFQNAVSNVDIKAITPSDAPLAPDSTDETDPEDEN